jgi:hypothetical protein
MVNLFAVSLFLNLSHYLSNTNLLFSCIRALQFQKVVVCLPAIL